MGRGGAAFRRSDLRARPGRHADESRSPGSSRPTKARASDGSRWPRRVRSRRYPEGVTPTEQYVIECYGTIGIMMKPPFTKLSALRPERRHDQVAGWSRRRCTADGGRDQEGTGVPQMRVSVLPTAGGLVFGLGGDSKVRAYDADTGAVLWTSARARRIPGSSVHV